MGSIQPWIGGAIMRYEIHKAAISFCNGKVKVTDRPVYWIWDKENKEYISACHRKKDSMDTIRYYMETDFSIKNGTNFEGVTK
jgi:hypothetical protein